MLLAIDIGNTNIVFAVFQDGKLLQSWRMRSDAGYTSDQYAAFLNPLLSDSSLSAASIQSIIIASVVPEADFTVSDFCQKAFEQTPRFVTKDSVDIAIDLDRPEEVGADRLVNAVAVCEYFQAPAIVIDFGTATTFDVINKDGAYAGGVIAPGIGLSMTALHQAASKLPKVRVEKPDSVIGKSTSHAMKAGVYYGYHGLIRNIVDEIKRDLGGDVQVIATGGLAKLFSGDSSVIDYVDDDLTLKGLALLHERMS